MTSEATETSVNARTEELPPWVAGVENRMHELDPELTEAQIDIVRGYGSEKSFADGDWLWRAGDRNASFYLVLSGEVQIVNTRGDDERIVITHGRGHYGGEVVTMAGRGALVGGRAVGDTTAIEVSAKRLREMIALESELGETMLISFIVRRMRMIAEEQGDVTLTGDPREPATGRLQSFLTRHGVPHQLINPAEDPDALAALGYETGDLPALAMAGCVLKKPTIREAADQLGIAAEIPEGAAYDVAIIGGGPSGMAAAVYAASEGLSAIVLECFAAGGQAATSSRIENYLGFPTGISGQGLAGRAFLQATKFGAEIAFARSLEKLECGAVKRLHLDGGDVIEARAVIIATGAEYREPPIENLQAYTGGGVHYGASFIEAQMCRHKDVVVLGGGNSAGQAAIYLSGYARTVNIVIRGDSLASSMSSYLIDRIDRTENIEVTTDTVIERAEGNGKLERLAMKNNRTGETVTAPYSQLFVFIGAVPASGFVSGRIIRDNRDFILTGDNLDAACLEKAGWPLERKPYYLETASPGIFAVGDVRSGSVKRVASAVGEGSVCIQFVHQYLDG